MSVSFFFYAHYRYGHPSPDGKVGWNLPPGPAAALAARYANFLQDPNSPPAAPALILIPDLPTYADLAPPPTTYRLHTRIPPYTLYHRHTP
jgi:hypothetical protein